MLPDPIVMGNPCEPVDTTPTEALSLPLIDPGAIGKAFRSFTTLGYTYRMTSGVQKTKEGGSTGSRRAVERLQLEQLDSDGKLVSGFCQITTGVPNAVIAEADILEIRQIALFHALYGHGLSGISLALGNANFLRRLAGEG